VTSLQVGSFLGFSAGIIAQALADHAPPEAEFHLVDPDMTHGDITSPFALAQRTLTALGGDLTARMRCHTGWFATRPRFQHGLPARLADPQWDPRQIPMIGQSLLEGLGRQIDFAFVDGDHSFAAVLADTLLVMDHLAPGGIMAHHDIRPWPGIALAMETLLGDGHYFTASEDACGLASVAEFYEIWPNTCDGLGVVELKPMANNRTDKH